MPHRSQLRPPPIAAESHKMQPTQLSLFQVTKRLETGLLIWLTGNSETDPLLQRVAPASWCDTVRDTFLTRRTS
jgi:hypothetical protein